MPVIQRKTSDFLFLYIHLHLRIYTYFLVKYVVFIKVICFYILSYDHCVLVFHFYITLMASSNISYGVRQLQSHSENRLPYLASLSWQKVTFKTHFSVCISHQCNILLTQIQSILALLDYIFFFMQHQLTCSPRLVQQILVLACPSLQGQRAGKVTHSQHQNHHSAFEVC